MTRTAAALALTAALLVLGAGTAAGQTPPTTGPPSPQPAPAPQRSQWTDPGPVAATPVTITGTAIDPRGIGVTGVAFTVAGGEPEGDPCRPSIAADRSVVTYAEGTGQRGESVPFETVVSFPCVGSWSVVARVGYRRPQVLPETEDLTLPVTVAVRPGTPTLRADRESAGVTLTWTQNPEPDLRTYVLERSDNGGASWTDVTEGIVLRDTSVVDDTAPAGERTRYRVSAVRGRAGLAPVRSVPSPDVMAPPAATGSTAGPGSSPSTSFAPSLGRLLSQATSSVPVPPPPPPTTIDDTFAQTLPFTPAPPTVPGAPTATDAPQDSPVVAILEGVGDADKKALAAPFAAALVLVLLAAHLRHFIRRAFD